MNPGGTLGLDLKGAKDRERSETLKDKGIMHHIFVINPKAGRVDRTPEIAAKLHQYDGKIDYEIYVTKSLGDAQGIMSETIFENHDPKETYRFYACGGDGTLYDVVNGSYGFPNVEVACVASGSGNDFVKNFHTLKFRDLDKEIAGKRQEDRPIKGG
jgi:diacylglycerol kinase family enzyme